MKPELVICSVLIGFCICACSPDDEQHKPGSADDRAKREEAVLVELAQRHNACRDWVALLPDRGQGKVFSVDVEKALVRTDGQPVAMVAELEDLSEESGRVSIAKFFMLPFLPYNAQKFFPLEVSLRCTAQQAQQLREAKPEPNTTGVGMRYAIVAKIESVSRTPPAPSTSQDADTVYAKGSCLDLTRLKLRYDQ